MATLFPETLRRLRVERGLSQQELADRMFVARPTIARWENGTRLPDAGKILQLAQFFGVRVDSLLSAAVKSSETPNVIIVEDREVILAGSLSVLERAIPNATVMGFEWPSEALEYAKSHRVSLALLDIELGDENGLDLCRALLEVNPLTNVVFLTAYSDYALDAWGTGACGFMLKPITQEDVRTLLERLRYPLPSGE